MRMRERSTAHTQTKKGLPRRVISREFPDFPLLFPDFSRFVVDFLISTGLYALVEHICHHQGPDI